MAALTNKHVTTSLKLLADVAADQAAKYDELSDSISDTDSDDNYQFLTPIYDLFYGQGRSATIMQITNFSPGEFTTLWTTIIHLVQPQSLKGRARKSTYSAKDAFFMTLVVLKNGRTWDFLAKLFHITSLTFERLITKCFALFSEAKFDKLVLSASITYPMQKLMNVNKCFKKLSLRPLRC